jgi:ATP-dependent DNA helicase PIF1
MIGRRNFGRLSLRLQEIFGNQLPFGGLDVVLVGDSAQLPPVKDKPKYDQSYNLKTVEPEVIEGITVYAAFETVVQLTRAYRQNAEDPFYSMLLRLREGEQTVADWEMLRPRHIHSMPAAERAEFASAVRFMSTNDAAETYNTAQLHFLNAVSVHLQARHEGVGASNDGADDYGGLEQHVRLAVGARVMLRKNEWTDLGLYNGALGWVRAILYDLGAHPSRGDLPTAIVVEFDQYLGPAFEGRAGHVAVPVRTMGNLNEKTKAWCTRSQVPLALAWASTIHKVQGQSVGPGEPAERMALNTGDREHAAGLTFVGISRAKALNAIAFDPLPNLDRFMRAGKCLQDANRKRHERVLAEYAVATKLKYGHLLPVA